MQGKIQELFYQWTRFFSTFCYFAISGFYSLMNLSGKGIESGGQIRLSPWPSNLKTYSKSNKMILLSEL